MTSAGSNVIDDVPHFRIFATVLSHAGAGLLDGVECAQPAYAAARTELENVEARSHAPPATECSRSVRFRKTVGLSSRHLGEGP